MNLAGVMNVAFLILAHDQPEHFGRLVWALDAPWACVFVHLDSKADEAPFRSRLEACNRVRFLADGHRVDVRWGEFSMVQATLNLLYTAYLHDVPFDRYCLLSGSDYPVVPLEEIRSRFATDTEFIRVDRCLDGSASSMHQGYVSRAHGHGGRHTRRGLYSGCTLYQGSQWWALTRGCVEYVIDYIRDHPDYTGFHRMTWCPDEIFFHSLVMASPYAGNVAQNAIRVCCVSAHEGNLHGCHYIDWHSGHGHPVPKVLCLDDAEKVTSSGALFARKFRQGSSDRLVEHFGTRGT